MAVTAIPATAGASPLSLMMRPKRGQDGFTPEEAADRRMPVQEQGRKMVEAGELTAATILFDGAAETQGDPVLYLDGADAYLELATTERDVAAAETAKLRALTAQDILYFHQDPEASNGDYRLVTDSEIPGLLSRAALILDRADTLVDEIEAEQEGLGAPEPAPAKKKGNGRGMRVAGIGMIGLGLAGLGVGAAGLVVGRVNQKKVDDPTVYGTEFDEYDTKGRRGNLIAGVGLAVGGAALATGVTLLILGRRRGAKAGSAPSESSPSSDEPPPPPVAVVPTGRGLALVGRF
ncbi:MAG: hypothetical protein H6712_17460 [Myxococcales bacterium]|nr:hypothetical protein [Myxococcales bacterium]MCB9715661.1 hypothetical protein [Myxococcales bacterium]